MNSFERIAWSIDESLQDRQMMLSRVRFTVRRMMVTVASVALVIGGSIEYSRLKRLSTRYAYSAHIFGLQETTCRADGRLSHGEWLDVSRRRFKLGLGQSLKPEWCRKLTPHYESLRLKYERAARYPWLPVSPDPPMPELIPSGASGGV
jgi:hypothetical protein